MKPFYRSLRSLRVFLFPMLVAGLCFFPGPARAGSSDSAVNVIYFIGDGMGYEQVKAGGFYKGAGLCFESWTNTAQVTTYSANNPVTDSAAAGTALATGVKVNNSVVSVAIPGDGSELETLLEYFKKKGKRTGLVTTTYITHATPAVFGAHETSRNNTSAIAADYLTDSQPNMLLGGGGYGMSVTGAAIAGYTVVTNLAGLSALDPASETRVSGQFGSGYMPYEYDGLGDLPHLSQMTEAALDILENEPAGFFLMVEGGRIDHAGHANDITRCVRETVEFDQAVQAAVAWASNRNDTLIIVTADHETGGLTVVADNGVGNDPTVTWSTTGHSAEKVGVWALGPKAGRIAGVLDNTDIHDGIVISYLLPATGRAVTVSGDSTQTSWTVRDGDVYLLTATENLLEPDWTPVAVVTAVNSTVIITDTNTPVTQKFYRLDATY